MLREILLVAIALGSPLAWADVEVNQAEVAALDSIRGIGPSMSRKIVLERNNGQYKNWADLMARVPGIKLASAAKFSAQGLTVNGMAFADAAKSPP